MTDEPIVTKVKWMTGWTDKQIAEVIGMSEPTVQAYRLGRIRENLKPAQIRALLTELRGWMTDCAECMAEIESRS